MWDGAEGAAVALLTRIRMIGIVLAAVVALL
jgi:hypothetical protein